MECTFTPGASMYASILARRLLIRFLPGLLAVLCIPAVWAFYDSRMIYLALILLFIIYPMIMSISWLTVTCSNHVTLCSRPQRWIFHDDSVTVDFLAYDGNTTVDTIAFKWKDVSVTLSGGRYIIETDENARARILILPVDKVPENLVIPLSDG